MLGDHHDRCRRLIDEGTPFVTVTLIEREGSVPQDVGSKIIVTAGGLDHGTVGGGRIEARAIQHAIELLSSGQTSELIQWNLNTDIGMTCGGRLRLFFECTHPHRWPIVIFGAGHVAQALTRLLMMLPCHVTCIDWREEWLDRLPDTVARIRTESLAEEVDRLPDVAFVLSMTQGHSHDLPVLRRIWETKRSFPYVGVIGSKSKAGALRRELREAGMPDGELAFRCPIGLPIGTNHPGEIAVSIAAELLQVRDQPVPRCNASLDQP